MAQKQRVQAHFAELLTIHVSEPDRKGAIHKIRVGRWIVNSFPQSVKLEKRLLYVDPEDGRFRPGRAEGFELEDLHYIAPKWPKIVEIMQIEEAKDNDARATSKNRGGVRKAPETDAQEKRDS